MKITLEQVAEALEHDYSVVIVVNGEYYELDEREVLKNERTD